LWGHQYKRRTADLLSITDDISNDVLRNVETRLAGATALRPKQPRTTNAAAYEAYLKGRYFWNQRPAGLDRSLEFFEEARTIDPDYALAHAGVALANDTMGSWETGKLDPNVAFPRAKVAALAAIALDPDNSAAHAALGFEQFNYEHEFEAAEQNLRQAVLLDPADSTPHHWLSHLYLAVGRRADSLRESLAALKLDPLDPVIMAHLGWHFMHAHDPDAALAQAEKTLAVYPTSFFSFWNRGIAYEEKRMLPQAIEAFRQALTLVPTATFATAGLAHALALSGRRAEAVTAAKELDATATYVSPFDHAIVALSLGDTDGALALLDRTVDEHNSWAIYLAIEPRLKPLRGDPRFISISRRAQARWGSGKFGLR
jgi:tetratricopeptide (TPR) repeat protein